MNPASELRHSLAAVTSTLVPHHAGVAVEHVADEPGCVVFVANYEPWNVHGLVRLRDGKMLFEQLHIVPARIEPEEYVPAEPDVPAAGITSDFLRHVRLGDLTTRIGWALDSKLDRVMQAASFERGGKWAGVESDPEVRRWRELRRQSRPHEKRVGAGPGPAARPDAFYEEVARRYIALHERGVRGLRQALADEYAKATGKPVSPNTVAQWVLEARRREFLAPVKARSTGAAPGPRLRAD